MSDIRVTRWNTLGIRLKGNSNLLSSLRTNDKFTINGVLVCRVAYSYLDELDKTQWLVFANQWLSPVENIIDLPMLKLDNMETTVMLDWDNGAMRKAVQGFAEAAASAANSLSKVVATMNDSAGWQSEQRRVIESYTRNPQLQALMATAIRDYRNGQANEVVSRSNKESLMAAEKATRYLDREIKGQIIAHNPLKPPQRRISLEDDV